jgi:hypothetical protein
MILVLRSEVILERYAREKRKEACSVWFDSRGLEAQAKVPTAGAINFSLDYGFGHSGGFVFQVDPGPPPYGLWWNYWASNSGPTLRIDGALGTALVPCIDVPTQFGHSNVVAELIRGPTLNVLEFSSERGARLLLLGNAGQTNVIEASTDLLNWRPVNTNVMDYSMCPICPYFIFEDTASIHLPLRFYRAFEVH